MFTYREKLAARWQKIHQNSTPYLSKQQSTQTGCYTIAACFPFEPLENSTTFKDISPGLSRTKVIFQDLPSPGLSGRRGNPEYRLTTQRQ